MFELRKWMTLSTTVLLILFIVHQLWQIYKSHRRGSGNWYVFTAITAVVALTILVDDVSLWLDRITQLNNFSWYLGYSLGVVSAASAGLVDCQMGSNGRYSGIAKTLAGLTIGTLLLLAFLYSFHMINTAEWVERDPRSGSELIFSVSFFLYDAIITVVTLYIARISVRLERNPLVRMRLQVGNACRYMAIVCFVAKLSYIVLEFSLGGYIWLNRLALIAMVIAALLWLTLVMPKRLYEWIIRRNPWTIYKQLRLLKELEGLQEQLIKVIPIADRYPYQNKSLFSSDLQMVTYRVIIQILDYKKMLDGYLNATAQERQQYSEIAWNQEQWLLAQRVYQALLPLNQVKDDSIHEVATALQIAAQKLKQR